MTKRLTAEQIQLLKDDLCVELAENLIDDYHYSPEEAIEVLTPQRPLNVCKKMRRGYTIRVQATSIHSCRTN